MSIKPFYCSEPEPYSILLQRRDRGKAICAQELQTARETVLSNGLKRPFVYSVRKRGEELAGYLIGTLHYCNEKMATDPLMRKVVEQSRHFFMERLPSWYATAAPADLVGRISSCPFSKAPLARLKMAFMMDSGLCAIARSKGIDCEPLNTEKEIKELETLRKEEFYGSLTEKDGREYQEIRSDSQHFTVSLAKGTINWRLSRTEEEQELEIAEYYQQGNAQQMHSFMVNLGAECLQKLIFEPNVRWANRSIIPAFTQRKGPICVVTGLYHLLGLPSDPAQTSLIKILRDNGFSVVRETADSLR